MYKKMYNDLQEVIELESEDIEKLLSIVEAKRQRISDCLKVIEALERGDFI